MQVASSIFPDDILELNGISPSLNVTRARKNAVCLACRSAKLLCGKPSCPILLKARVFTKIKARLDTSEIVGDSPPSAFVGRFGYPKVSFGPMIPPVEGETSIYDAPERWLRFSFDRIIEYRSLLIRGNERAHVGEAKEPRGLLEQLQISMSVVAPRRFSDAAEEAPLPRAHSQ